MKRISFCFLLLFIFLSGCARIDLFEKAVTLPKQEWALANRPEITFDIKDTSASYKVYFIVRHTDAYRYNNLWIKLYSKLPGEQTERSDRYEIPLSTDSRWLGTGMDDIFDHRVLLYHDPVKFFKPGRYTLRLEQDMRVDPLENVLNVGIRIEKQH